MDYICEKSTQINSLDIISSCEEEELRNISRKLWNINKENLKSGMRDYKVMLLIKLAGKRMREITLNIH